MNESESNAITPDARRRLFQEARTFNAWQARPVHDAQLIELYELLRWAPTSANSNPARFAFVRTAHAKERLVRCMAPGNVEKTRSAPVNVIVAYDTAFHDQLPKLMPHTDMRKMFLGKPAYIEETAFRNSTLQGGYFIIAARALGLDCGAMSGFDAEMVNQSFFPDGNWKANFVCNLGYGDTQGLFPRSPRLEADEACVFL